MAPESHQQTVQREFERTAAAFARRTAGRFDEMGVVEFARAAAGETVAEIGAGTGNFLSLFAAVAGRLVAVDLTPGMLSVARRSWPQMELLAADGARLPLRRGSIDLVASAQVLHHVWGPLPILKEMRRVMAAGGRMLVVDQSAPESYEQAAMMNELEVLRDPSHAVSRPLSAMRILVKAAGFEIVDERRWEGPQRMSAWMWAEEFPPERIQVVRNFIAKHGHETGMDFEREGDDWLFTRRRYMILAANPPDYSVPQ